MLLKKINKTKIIVLVIMIVAIILAVIGSIFNSSKKENNIEAGEIQAKYYVVQQEYQYGVIDTKRKYNNRYSVW